MAAETATPLARTKAQPPANDAPPSTLWAAFAKAQAGFGAIVKSATGASATQKYAPLDAVLEIVRPVLNANGLALTQPVEIDGDTLVVRTLLIHTETGETHECRYPAGAITLQHQSLGAGVTYARRYSLLSILGVFPANEDDDGESAGPAGGDRPRSRPQQQSSAALKREDAWGRFERTLQSFRDIDELEGWWADGGTQAKIEQMPPQWREQAAEAYEKRQEALLNAGRP